MALIILDLDETLIYASKKSDLEKGGFEVLNYRVSIRPHLNSFLEYLKENFKIAVWSSATEDFVSEIVKRIFPEDFELEFVWSRDKCTYKPNHEIAESVGYFDYYSHYDFIKNHRKVRKNFTYRK